MAPRCFGRETSSCGSVGPPARIPADRSVAWSTMPEPAGRIPLDDAIDDLVGRINLPAADPDSPAYDVMGFEGKDLAVWYEQGLLAAIRVGPDGKPEVTRF